MNPLKINITGVRGIVGETLSPHLIVQFIEAFGTYIGGGEVFVCDDARRSAPMALSAVFSGLLSTGCEPVDFGACPTPSMQFAIKNSQASGGVAVSAGHNSEEWNALRFIRPDGMYFTAQQGDELLDVYHAAAFTKAPWDAIKKLRRRKDPFAMHLAAIMSSVNAASIKKRKFRVVLDTCNGACSHAAPQLLESLGCSVICLHNEPGKPFPHNPEPSPDNTQPLAAIAAATGCHIGFMLDTAGERLGIVTGEGQALPEETTLPLCAMFQLESAPGPVVTNLSTTRAIDDLAKRARAPVIRTPIGQAYVTDAARKHSAAIAGEGSGGVIIPAVQYNNDSLAAMAFILHHLAARGETLSQLVGKLPRYFMKKKKVEIDPIKIYSAMQSARDGAHARFPNARINLEDGVKAEWPDSWLHLRPSNTESLIRIIAEARTESRAEKLMEAGEEILA